MASSNLTILTGLAINPEAPNYHGFYLPALTSDQAFSIPQNELRDGFMIYLTDFNNIFISKGGKISVLASYTHRAVNANYTIVSGDYIIGVNAPALTALTITLPAPSDMLKGQSFAIKDEVGNAGTTAITVNTLGGTIDGAATKLINTNYGSFTFYCDNTNWFTLV